MNGPFHYCSKGWETSNPNWWQRSKPDLLAFTWPRRSRRTRSLYTNRAVPVLRQSGPSERELLLYSLKNEAMMLEELHREADRIRVQGQIDAIENIKSQSVEPRV
jgi:hypothetical protein